MSNTTSDNPLDADGVYLMKLPVKMYVFKDAQEVKVSFRITDYCVINRTMTIEQMQTICDNWDVGEGIQGMKIDGGKIFWYRSRSGPRPEQIPADFVVINTYPFSLRISTPEMRKLVENFKYQLNNKMHWD